MTEDALWLVNGVCDCCGTREGIKKNGSTPQQQNCGPTIDCDENRIFRNLLKRHVHRDHAKDVCDAFGVSLVNVDDKRDMRHFN